MEKGKFHLPKSKLLPTAKQTLAKYKKARFVRRARLASFQASLDIEKKKSFFRRNRWLHSTKVKSLIVFTIITVMLVSIFAFLPKQNENNTNILKTSDNSTISTSGTIIETKNQTHTPSGVLSGLAQAAAQVVAPTSEPKPPGLIASAQTINSTVWLKVAANAWNYFQPGAGVDSITGLPYSNSPVFTDWDLGVYIQAVIDARKIGLIDTDGDWGFNSRIDKVLTFLENRTLNPATKDKYPYWFYQATNGENFPDLSNLATTPYDGVDTGRLFVALNNVKVYNTSWAFRIDSFVYNIYGNRTNYATMIPNIKSDVLSSTSIYAYYIYSGFASFWPKDLINVQSTILNNIFSAGNTTTPDGVLLPKAEITGDPLLCSVFELNNTDSRLMTLSYQVYLAHEAYYNETGKYRAFSEGPSMSGGWEYEWVVLPDGRTWTLDESNSNTSPLIYSKVALGFLAIYNTTYAKNMSVYLENTLPEPSIGYCEGVDESGHLLERVGSNSNSLILDAALYAIQNNP